MSQQRCVFRKNIGQYRGLNGYRYNVEVSVNEYTVDRDTERDTDLNLVPEGTKFLTVFVGAGTIAPKCRNENGWTNYEEVSRQCPKLRGLTRLAKRTHFGNMRSGTRIQQAAVDGWMAGRCLEWKAAAKLRVEAARAAGSKPNYWDTMKAEDNIRYDYSEVCGALKKLGLYEDRGYVYGSAWLIDADLLESGEDLLELVKAELDKLGVKD